MHKNSRNKYQKLKLDKRNAFLILIQIQQIE